MPSVTWLIIGCGLLLFSLIMKMGITAANMSILKTGKALDCQPGDILEYRPGPDYEEEGE